MTNICYDICVAFMPGLTASFGNFILFVLNCIYIIRIVELCIVPNSGYSLTRPRF